MSGGLEPWRGCGFALLGSVLCLSGLRALRTGETGVLLWAGLHLGIDMNARNTRDNYGAR